MKDPYKMSTSTAPETSTVTKPQVPMDEHDEFYINPRSHGIEFECPAIVIIIGPRSAGTI